MSRLIALAAAAVISTAFPASGLGRSTAASLCVGVKAGCFATVQAAVDAAHDGDTITIAAGTFAGGVTITKSVTLNGAGAKQTVLSGGGPVLTIGSYLADSVPTVTLARLTVTGGVTTSSAQSEDWFGTANVIATGGGIEIPPSAGFGPGATVSITDSVVSGNRVTPTATLPIGPPCPTGPCTFAWALGGGIDTWGSVTLTNTRISNNLAAGVASDADGGGIHIWGPGSVALHSCAVDDNEAIASVPNGRYAEGGGIFGQQGIQLTIDGGEVNGNVASLTSTLPFEVPDGTLDMNANGGGVHTGDGSTLSIDGVTFRQNSVSVDDPNGEPYAFDAALHPGDGPLVLRNSVLDGNSVLANVASTEDVGPSGSAIDLVAAGTVENLRITGNTTVVTSHAGTAGANGAVYAGAAGSDPLVIEDSQLSGNTVHASANGGPVQILGGGITNDGLLVLRNDLVAGNTATADGATGFARGGGIWSGHLFNGGNVRLTLDDTAVLRNTLTGSSGIELSGGGLFTDQPVTLSNAQVARNAPDQCVGC
jgi:hypothetical protein